jgi:hypothetical protein
LAIRPHVALIYTLSLNHAVKYTSSIFGNC